MSRQHAYRLIGAGEVAKNLEKCNPGVTKKLSEKQCRPLSGLPKREQIRKWKKAVKSAERQGRTVTAKDVQATVIDVSTKLDWKSFHDFVWQKAFNDSRCDGYHANESAKALMQYAKEWFDAQ